MSGYSRLIAFAAAALLLVSCSSNAPQRTDGNYPLTIHEGEAGIFVPEHGGRNLPPLPDQGAYDSNGPFTADLADLAATPPAAPGKSGEALLRGGGRIETPIPESVVERLREQARFLPPSLALQDSIPLADSGQTALGPVAGSGFDSLDINDCCGGGANVPPDPELAVGPNQIVAVVNVAFEIYSKSGTQVFGPTQLANFFSGVTGCSSPFDPNVLYDEDHDRFIIGVDSGGGYYCVAASVTGDPTGAWNRYSFQTASGADFFDYPHAAVGDDAIYMGANIFLATGGFKEGRIWAMDKTAMYAGSSMAVVTHSTGGESSPHPVYLHGAAQGTWPWGDPEYILTDGPFDGNRYGVWSWMAPFGDDLLSNLGTVNLANATGVTAGMPIDAPQSGGGNIQANDWRVQDAEYRDGYVWMTHTIACNPGGGTVNCLRWAQIDPTGPSVVDAGVLGTSGEHRTFADGAVDACGDFGVGYTKTSSSMYPAVWAAGREAGDTPGTLQAEMEFKPGEVTYTAFDGAPYRWGDYSEMAIDPDGVTFWYLGEYTKNTGSGYGLWGTWIGSFSFASCTGGSTSNPPGQANNPNPADGATGVDINADLAWTAGASATTHHVYFGVAPNLADLGTTSSTSFALPTLAYSTTYNWRIDETNDNGTTTGTVWTFTTMADPSANPPGQASNPSPADGATGVAVNPSLSWTVGSLATLHEVFFGTNPSPGSGELKGSQTGTSYDPGTLAYDTVYYWRIDEVNPYGTTTGSVWNFTTGSPSPSGALHVAGLTGSAVPGSRGRWNAVVQVSVADQDDSPVSGVTVSGNWSNGASGGGSCITDAGGQCAVSKNNLKSNVASVTFTVSGLALSNYSYASGDNVLTSVVVGQTDTNLFPVARDDSFSTDVNTQVSGNVLGNDDLGDTPTTVTAYDAAGTAGGSVSMNSDGSFTYTPPSGFTGDDSFGYTITDNTPDSSSATVTVSVGSSPPSGPALSATPFKVKGLQSVDLAWTGFGGDTVTVTRDRTTTVTNSGSSPDGSTSDNIGAKGGGVTYQYQACDNATPQSCASASATF